MVTETGQVTQSHLVIRNAREGDEGNYTCKPSIFKSASVRLFVIDGKKNVVRKHKSLRVVGFELDTQAGFSEKTISRPAIGYVSSVLSSHWMISPNRLTLYPRPWILKPKSFNLEMGLFFIYISFISKALHSKYLR